SGAYSARALSVGADNAVRVTSSEYGAQTVEDVRLSVGDTTSVPFVLSAATAGGDEIIVTSSRSTVSEVASGPSAVFSAQDLAFLPALNRDIKDVIRLDPRINIDESFERGIRCVGSNERFNSLTVDGVRQNDDFGLNNNGFPTQRLPFPFDAVEQVAVEIAPVDVEYGGFTGCNINAVTKTGGNEFHGRLFVDYNFAGLHGNSLEGDPVSKPETDEKSYGAVITGPIIPDRLFFTAAYEKFSGSDTTNTGPAGSAFASTVDEVTQADIDRITSIMNSVYGFDPLGIPTSSDVQDERFYIKLNGYLNENHRFELAYQDTFGDNVVPQNTSSSRGELSLASNWYRRSEDLEAYSGRLFSEWTDQLSTELRVSYQDRITGQNSLNGTDFAQFEIGTPGGGSVFVGPDNFRHGNRLEVNVWNFKAKAEYAAGDHLFKIGYERDIFDVFNQFVPFSEGDVSFDSIDDLELQMPSSIFYLNAGTNNKDDGAATFKRTINTIYAQNDWTPRDDFTMVTGLRFDWYSQGNAPEFNPLIETRFGVANNETFDGLSLIQPRIGFEYDVNDRLSLSAGAGRFSGGDPSVWLSNSFSNTGLITGTSFSADPAVINGFDGFTLPAAMQAEVTASAAAGTGQVALVDPDYKLSSIWRFSLGGEYYADLSSIGLGDDWSFGVDFLYTIQENPNIWQNLDLGQIGTAPDGRPIYNSQFGYRNSGVLMLTNSDLKPETFVLSGYVNKSWEWDRLRSDFYAGYAHTSAEDVNPATSSTQQSNFENVAAIDYNNPIIARSNYGLEHAFTMRWDLAYEFIRDYETRLSFVGQLNSGKPFSYTYDTNGGSDAIAGGANLFGDSDDSERRSQIYVPTGMSDPLVDLSMLSTAQINELFNFFESSGLNEFAGSIAPRNGFESDWWGKLDLRFEQQLPGIPGIFEDDRLRFIIDIDNFTNLLNDDWGVYREVTFGGSGHNAAIIESEISADGSQFVITDTNIEAADQDRIFGASVWEINFGLRYDF
ncbi:MAG: TonB-dependent receptor, partial [Marinicaulis sp.]|nr:TonB-dependent receptor [Marinicaulis sp.]